MHPIQRCKLAYGAGSAICQLISTDPLICPFGYNLHRSGATWGEERAKGVGIWGSNNTYEGGETHQQHQQQQQPIDLF